MYCPAAGLCPSPRRAGVGRGCRPRRSRGWATVRLSRIGGGKGGPVGTGMHLSAVDCWALKCPLPRADGGVPACKDRSMLFLFTAPPDGDRSELFYPTALRVTTTPVAGEPPPCATTQDTACPGTRSRPPRAASPARRPGPHRPPPPGPTGHGPGPSVRTPVNARCKAITQFLAPRTDC